MSVLGSLATTAVLLVAFILVEKRVSATSIACAMADRGGAVEGVGGDRDEAVHLIDGPMQAPR